MPVRKIKNSLNCHNSGFIKGSHNFWFLADRTNGRAIATLLRLSSVVVVVCHL